MKKVFNRTIFDTDKAECVYDVSTPSVLKLYRTKKGNWFVYTSSQDGTHEDITPLWEPQLVIDWLEERGLDELLLKYFAEYLYDA